MSEATRWMLLHGVGPVEVRALDDGAVEVRERDELQKSEEIYVLDADEAGEALRELISVEHATQLRANFGGVNDPPADERERKRALRYAETFDSGTIDEQAATLRSIYRHPSPEAAETANQHRFEALVVEEIALVLGLDPKRLVAEIRSEARDDAIPAAVDLPNPADQIQAAGPPPPMVDAHAVGVLAIEDTLCFGPSGTEMTTPALPGIWFGYAVGELDDPTTVLVVHHTHVATAAKIGALDGIGDRLDVEGGQLIAVDGTALQDPDMRRDVDAGGNGNRPHRALRFHLGGDGTWTAAIIDINDAAVAIIAR